MKNFLTLAITTVLLTSCSSKRDPYDMNDLRTPDEIIKKGEKFCKDYKKKNNYKNLANLDNALPLIEKANYHMEKLSRYFYDQGLNSEKVFQELNGHGSPEEGTIGDTLMRDIIAEKGKLTCISNGVIKVDTNPYYIGKKSTSVLKTEQNKPLLTHLIQEMRTPSDEKVITFGMIPSDIKSPMGSFLQKKYVVVAFGRNALLKEKLNKNNESKFMCYVAYPAQ